MRILQLIDSLDAGGAERMAVSLANGLHGHIEKSFLCTTRKEGVLRDSILPEVGYLFLFRRKKIDIRALKKLYNFVKKNHITIIHAHSTSFFFATCLKLAMPSLKLIWHDHYGQSEQLESRKFRILKQCSRFFSAILSVNSALKEWSLYNLMCQNVFYVKNFAAISPAITESNPLKGGKELNIVCVANFRPQKDHMTLIKAFSIVKNKNYDIALHLIGAHVDMVYTNEVIKEIEIQGLKNIYVYGEQQNISSFLQHADLAVLSSISEGLPVSLLEYGMHRVPVVCTDVGQCREVLAGKGYITPPQDPASLAKGMLAYLRDERTRTEDARLFYEHVTDVYSINNVLPKFLEIYNI